MLNADAFYWKQPLPEFSRFLISSAICIVFTGDHASQFRDDATLLTGLWGKKMWLRFSLIWRNKQIPHIAHQLSKSEKVKLHLITKDPNKKLNVVPFKCTHRPAFPLSCHYHIHDQNFSKPYQLTNPTPLGKLQASALPTVQSERAHL